MVSFFLLLLTLPSPQHGLLVLSPASPTGIYSQVSYLMNPIIQELEELTLSQVD